MLRHRHRFINLVALVLIGFIAACGFQGCAATGMPAPQTFEQKALAGEYTIKGVLDSATMLRSAGKLSSANVKSIVTGADAAQEGINVARALHKVGCPAAAPAPAASAPPGMVACTPQDASNRLQLALAGLTLLQQYLATLGASSP